MGNYSAKDLPDAESISFKINGKQYDVGGVYPATSSLNSFIRNVARLTGTKYQCYEGGCGSCVVHVKTTEGENKAINSCLMPLYSCDGLEITTVEGLGDRKRGYHPIQKQLAEKNGTQCGYCSSGMVMNILDAFPDVTMADVEDNFGGNICRCTGYRPIMDAMKGFAKDAPPSLKCNVDIEDLCGPCPRRSEGNCTGPCDAEEDSLPKSKSLNISLDGTEWKRPISIQELTAILSEGMKTPYRIVAGNTGVANITIGALVTLTKMVSELKSIASTDKMFSYANDVANHIRFIANPPVRNSATWAGNMMMKKLHPDFPSDLYVILEAIGAKMQIKTPSGDSTLNIEDFLNFNMEGCFINSLILLAINPDEFVFKSFKVEPITPRFESAHAYVNAAFLLPMPSSGNPDAALNGRPTLCFGGIRPDFVRAVKTEAYLEDKALTDQSVVQGALAVLSSELDPDSKLQDTSPEHRRDLAVSLLYKTILALLPVAAVNPRYLSGARALERPDVYHGSQEFSVNESMFPVGKPILKLEAYPQTSGEAEYINDIPSFPGELQGTFALSEVGNAELGDIDGSEALLLCSKFVMFAGQPVAMVLAETKGAALYAANLVKITYKNVQKPILSVKDAVELDAKLTDEDRRQAKGTILEELVRHNQPLQWGEPIEVAEQRASKVVSGIIDMGTQHHFCMENQISIAVPLEDGMDIFCATQWMDTVQAACGQVLDWPNHKFNLKVRRLGGGYGAKISKANFCGTASALGAFLTNRPVRAGADDDGKLVYVMGTIYGDVGCCFNENVVPFAAMMAQNAYYSPSWVLLPKSVRTNTPSNTWTRSPGTTEGIAFAEHILERVAAAVNKDPLEVRRINFIQEGQRNGMGRIFKVKNELPMLLDLLEEKAQIKQRKQDIQKFNEANRWKKQGISVVPMLYPHDYVAMRFPVILSIYRKDGTVAVSHGGIEMGQGLNTKVAQATARELGVPLELVQVKPSNNLVAANSSVTGGSFGSELCCQAAIQACRVMNERLAPLKEQHPNISWKELIEKAYAGTVDLTVWDSYSEKSNINGYIVWGVTATHVEVDILTGEKMIRRVDLIEDAGESISPLLDVGQVEGAYVMGMGYWLQEEVKYDPETGKSLNKNTWEYKPPLSKDIPADFRVTLLPNAPNANGVLRSKATGEPPLCMSVSALFAVKNAIHAARVDVGNPDWWDLAAPATNDKIQQMALTTVDQMTFK
ncbi:unnamed protein product [Cyprideis torosa]|uniref:Uncharacterized protein n=1 Tax=Cyprideis torosa TaxID=163714 RepID=A0A7R8ZPL2_9CRUS|nr:unnamed protein product [Cyprideis torosa]CAG0900815.1 unnamed protein product [Cyprideis torosa]